MLNSFVWQGGDASTSLFKKLRSMSIQPPGTFVEIVFGEDNLRPIYVLEIGLVASKSVCKLTSGPATAFLINEDILITNNHVLPDINEAIQCKAQFNFQITPEGLSLPIDEYELDPDKLFITNVDLDFTIVKTKGNPGLKWGYIHPQKQNPVEGNAAILIQHPKGGYKQICLGDNEIRAFVDNGKKIQYLSDSSPGSSGSPVFDENFHLIGLHHASILTPDNSRYFRNEAIHINAIIDILPNEILIDLS